MINKAISLTIPIIVQNNAAGVARVLRQLGYEKKTIIPAAELEAKMFQLYLADPKKFFAALANIEWLQSETETNKPEIKNKLIAIVGLQETPDTKGDWWKKLVSMLKQEAGV
jgi:hypothetical protein